MTESRIIKKYPNRRLYDTAISRYITLDDVRQLALDNEKFRVIDARSKDDITRSILLQIISEQEEHGSPIFTTDVLANIIRFYGDTLQGMMGNYLEKSLQSFVDQQDQVRDQMSNFMGKNPLAMMSDMAERNMEVWQSMNKQLYGKTPDSASKPENEASPEAQTAASEDSRNRPPKDADPK